MMMNTMQSAPPQLVGPHSPKTQSPILRQPRLVSMADIGALTANASKERSGSGVFYEGKELNKADLVHIQHHIEPTPLGLVDDEGDVDLQDIDEDLFDFSNPLPPKKELEPAPLPDIKFRKHRKTGEDVDNLSKAVGQWKPFVDRVAKFVEKEKFPFEYVDVWVMDDTTANSNNDGSTSKCQALKCQALKHVGHATNHRTELCSILTMYHMNQFGSISEKYVFPPGVGLPGRVLARGEPVWDDKLPSPQTFKDFPRNQLARKHGVHKGLGIPLFLPGTTKQAIVVMYTTNDRLHLNDNRGLLDMMYREFQRRSSVPMLVGDSATIIDEDMDDATIEDDIAYHAILPCSTEVQMASILRDSSASDSENSINLQCLLWRAPCRRSLQDNKRLDVLKQKFRAYQNDNDAMSDDEGEQKQDYEEVAKVILDAWEEILLLNSGSREGFIVEL